jgi:hypothetical protein
MRGHWKLNDTAQRSDKYCKFTKLYKYTCNREDSMIYRGPGFLSVVWFGSTPIRFPLLPSGSCLSFSVFCVSPRMSSLLTGEAEGGLGAKSPQESLALYKSFNTLCLPPISSGSALTVRNTPSQVQGWPFPQCQCIDNFRTPWTRRKIY